jgi:hypothetical protein
VNPDLGRDVVHVECQRPHNPVSDRDDDTHGILSDWFPATPELGQTIFLDMPHFHQKWHTDNPAHDVRLRGGKFGVLGVGVVCISSAGMWHDRSTFPSHHTWPVGQIVAPVYTPRREAQPLVLTPSERRIVIGVAIECASGQRTI